MRWILLAASLVLVGCNTSGEVTRLPAATSASIGLAGTLIAAQRAQAGVSLPVTQNPALQAAAQAHADDLAARTGLSHTGRDGSTVMQRVRRAGYQACYVAENIARGQPDVPSVIRAWSNSPGHYQNMVNPSGRQFGFARSNDVWVLVLARPC